MLLSIDSEGQSWCSGEICLTESPGRWFEAVSSHWGGGGLPRLGLPFFLYPMDSTSSNNI
jgi:hypothetical protein